MVLAALRKAASLESFPVLSLGGVGGLGRNEPSIGATSTIVSWCYNGQSSQTMVTSRVVMMGVGKPGLERAFNKM